MGITIAQVKADIKSGKCKAIYMCSQSLWWTHEESDLIESYMIALKQGKNVTIPVCSPIGFDLIINKDPKQWLKTSERFTKEYGKHRLAALMKVHHQNNSTHFYNKWQKYNDLIDEENKLKIVK